MLLNYILPINKLIFKSFPPYIFILFSGAVHALTGSTSVGSEWQSVVYIEFSFKGVPEKTTCSGFLINDFQVITSGHCFVKDEGKKKSNGAKVCIGKRRPFTGAGEGCFESGRISLARNYAYGGSNDVSLINLSERIPVNFLGITPTKLLPAALAESLLSKPELAKEVRIISFGARQFNHPTLAKKGWSKVKNLTWDKLHHLWVADVPKTTFGQADDGAGLLIRTKKRGQWYLAGILTKAKPDHLISVLPVDDPCAPPQPPPRQPSILLTSFFEFSSVNLLACSNSFLPKRLSSQQLCQSFKQTRTDLEKFAQSDLSDGRLAYQLANQSSQLRYQLKWLNISLTKGFNPAKFQLSEIFYEGKGVKTNLKRGNQLLLDSAKAGYPPAQYLLAQKIKNNQVNFSSKENDISWLDWILISAKKGYPAAQYDYAMHLMDSASSGVYDWLMRASRQGYAPAQYMLAKLYEDGFDVKKNLQISREWMEYSAGQGYHDAILYLERNPRTEYEIYDDEF